MLGDKNATSFCTKNISTLHENSKLKPGENMLGTEIVSDIQNNFFTQRVLPMFYKKKSFWQKFTCTDQAPSSTPKPEAQAPKATSANPAESASTVDNETPSFLSQILQWIRSVVREFFRRLFHGTPYQLA